MRIIGSQKYCVVCRYVRWNFHPKENGDHEEYDQEKNWINPTR